MKRSEVAPHIVLVEELPADDGVCTPPVLIARVDDPSKLLDGRTHHLHGDVVDALAELVIELLDRQAPDAP